MRYRLEGADGVGVAVAGGRLVEPTGSFDLSLAVGPGRLRPGLVNAHDHLHRNHYPRLGSPPYRDAYAWGRDLHDRWADEVARGRAFPRRDALLFGALKTLLGGATSVVHHDPWEPDFENGFPVRVVPVRAVHSLGFEADPAGKARGDPDRPLCLHLAEGVGPAAAEEVREAERLGLLGPRLLAVHGVGVDTDGAARLAAAGAALVWCPTSNAFLFGRTAPGHLFRPDVDVLLGSDSLLTGEGTLLDELRAARGLGLVDPARLEEAVGATAARRLGVEPPRLEPGAAADLIVLGRPLGDARAEDVDLVVVGGFPRLAHPRFGELFDALGVAAETLRVGGAEKLVMAPLARVARRVADAWPDAVRILEGRAGGTPRTARLTSEPRAREGALPHGPPPPSGTAR